MRDERCAECGAPLPEGGGCQDLFHAQLALEAGFPGAAGSILHFYLVAAYNLQHPDSAGLTAAALPALARNLADALDGKASVAELRRRARQASDGPARVRRRPGDPPPAWYRGPWPLTVADVLGATEASYPELVTDWARSVRRALESS